MKGQPNPNISDFNALVSTLLLPSPQLVSYNIGVIYFLELFDTYVCDHMRATEYYIATVQNLCSWKAFPCQSYRDFKAGKCLQCNGECPTMGYGADETKKSGDHYLKTTSKAPFCGE